MNYFKFLIFFLIISLSGISKAQTTKDTLVITEIDTPPSFPNGYKGWRNFLFNNLQSEVPIENGAPSGMYNVIIGLIIEKDGTLSEIKPLTNFGYGMEEEAVRVISKSGKWKPGMQSSKIVRSYLRQPIIFLLRPEKIDFTLNDKFDNYVLNVDKENILIINSYNNSGKKSTKLEVKIDKGIIKKMEKNTFSILVDNSVKQVNVSIIDKKNFLYETIRFQVE